MITARAAQQARLLGRAVSLGESFNDVEENR
jgi:hypothetical protein